MRTQGLFGWCIVALATGIFGCDKDPAASAADAGVESGARGVDPFCRTRPRLSFCEDFDELEVPGHFASVEGSRDIITREANENAPSAPNVITIAHSASATDARLYLSADQGVKYNFFFFVNVQPGHGRIDVAGIEDGAYRLTIGLEENNTWYVEEQAGAVDGGTPAARTLATTFGPELGTFSSVRFDVYVDGAGVGHMRFRSGDDMVFASESLTFGDGKTTLTPKLFVGARVRSGAPAKLSFDSVTLGED